MNLDRSAISQAVAKAIAYKQCGKDSQADAWAAQLVHLLGCSGILVSLDHCAAVAASLR